MPSLEQRPALAGQERGAAQQGEREGHTCAITPERREEERRRARRARQRDNGHFFPCLSFGAFPFALAQARGRPRLWAAVWRCAAPRGACRTLRGPTLRSQSTLPTLAWAPRPCPSPPAFSSRLRRVAAAPPRQPWQQGGAGGGGGRGQRGYGADVESGARRRRGGKVDEASRQKKPFRRRRGCFCCWWVRVGAALSVFELCLCVEIKAGEGSGGGECCGHGLGDEGRAEVR